MAEATEKARQLIYGCLKARRAVVLGFMGPNFCGKSRLLGDVKDRLDERALPYALVDLEQFAVAAPDELLDRIVVGLSASRSAYGRVRFHRYLLARSVLTMDIPGPAPNVLPTPDQVREAVHRRVRSGWRRDALRSAADLLAPAVKLLPGPSGALLDLIRSVVAALADLVVGNLPAWLLRPGAGWFARNTRLGPARSADDALTLLWLSAHGGAPDPVERTLVAAFLADLRAGARRGRLPIRWKVAYALLIDNADRVIRLAGVDHTPGKRLVSLLAGEMTNADRLTVAVTHRGSLLASVGAVFPNAPVMPAVAVPFADQAEIPPRGTRWWPVRLPDLDVTDIRDRIRAATQWPEGACEEAATAVYRFTRGHPGGTDLVLDALSERQAPRDGFDLGAMVTDDLRRELLDKLINQVAPERELTTCAAVRDREHVPWLVGHGISRQDLSKVQDDTLWVPGPPDVAGRSGPA